MELGTKLPRMTCVSGPAQQMSYERAQVWLWPPDPIRVVPR